jgi:outer membrane protein TolC
MEKIYMIDHQNRSCHFKTGLAGILIGLVTLYPVYSQESELFNPGDSIKIITGPVTQQPPLKEQDIWEAALPKTDPVVLLLKVNRKVIATKRTYEAALERVATKGVLPDPMVENAVFLQPVETKNGPMKNQLMLGQRFPLWGKLSRQKKIAVLQAENASLQYENAKIGTVFQLNKLRANYRKISRSLEILKQYKSELESFRDVALTQYSTGAGVTQHPILKLQIEMGMIESRINLLQSKLKSVESDLQTLFDGQFSPDLFNGPWRLEEHHDEQQWLELAQKLNPQLHLLKNQVTINTLQEELAIRSNYPDLVAGITYTSIGSGGMDSSAGKDALGIKAGINIPLWFKRNKARVESATLEKKAREEMLADVWNQISGDVVAIEKDIQELEATHQLYEKSLIKQSEQMIASAYSAYETGKISFLDLLDSERMDVKIRLEYENVKADLYIAKASMYKTIGKIK